MSKTAKSRLIEEKERPWVEDVDVLIGCGYAEAKRILDGWTARKLSWKGEIEKIAALVNEAEDRGEEVIYLAAERVYASIGGGSGPKRIGGFE